jgi:DNA primase
MKTWKEQLKDSIEPIAFYQQEGQEIRTAGSREWKVGGLCPFHEDRFVGSFYINATTGSFKCFSCGESGGDIIAFAQLKYNIGFSEAVVKLRREWRVI